MNKSRMQNLCSRLFCAVALGLVLLIPAMTQPAAASSGSFESLLPANCKPDAPRFAGITHCTLNGEKNGHIVLVNLSTPGLRFETALPVGADGRECTDVNVPAYAAPGRGCLSGNKYPFESVSQIAERYPGVSVAINADYFGVDDHMHGAEGLAVKNGQRFDGWELGDCDSTKLDRAGKASNPKEPTPCDGNDIKRPSMIISRDNQHIEIGYRTEQELDDKSVFGDRIFNAVGGGPLIVRQGTPLPNTACANDPGLPEGRVCDSKSQMGVALSGDGKTLILAMGDHDASWMAALFTQSLQAYGIQTALKLDGGGSPALWFGGQLYGTTGSGGGKGQVGEALLIFAPGAPDLDASFASQSDLIVTDPGQSQTVSLTITNTGASSWNPQTTLVNTNNQPLGANPTQSLHRSDPIPPYGGVQLSLVIQAPQAWGYYSSDWQLNQGSQAFGPKESVTVIVLPPQAKDLRDRLNQEIDQWRKTGEQKKDEFVHLIEQQVADWVAQQGQNAWDGLKRHLGCANSLAFLAFPLLGLWLFRSRR